MHGYFGAKQVSKRFLVNAPIVSVIIGEMLWDPDEIEGDTHEKMMSSFEDYADPTEELADGQDVDRLCMTIANQVQFGLAIDYFRIGCTFRQSARVMLATKERTGLAAIGSCSDYTIAKYARFACAINLQKISELLEYAWTLRLLLTCQLT